MDSPLRVTTPAARQLPAEIGGIEARSATAQTRSPCDCRSARPEVAIPLYEQFVRKISEDLGKPVQTGEFGADMKVSLTNDGPVTIVIDSKNPE